MDLSHGKYEIWKSKDCKPASFQVSCHFVCGVLGLNPEKHMEGIHHLSIFWISMIIEIPNSRYRNFSTWCHFVCPFCFQNKNTAPKDSLCFEVGWNSRFFCDFVKFWPLGWKSGFFCDFVKFWPLGWKSGFFCDFVKFWPLGWKSRFFCDFVGFWPLKKCSYYMGGMAIL